MLDKHNDGSVTMEDLMEVYDVSLHPDVFCRQDHRGGGDFDLPSSGIHDERRYPQNEFIDYYHGVSTHKDDEHFEELIKSAWKLQDDMRTTQVLREA